jgi:ketosteroid isomerase-like protein
MFREVQFMNKDLILEFVDRINAHDVDGIASFLAAGHVFIDAHAHVHKGKETMRAAWTEYFKIFPDYKVEVEDVLEQEARLAIFGHASATFKGPEAGPSNFWRLPAAWKAVIRKGKIEHWQVYCDYKIIYDIIQKNQ